MVECEYEIVLESVKFAHLRRHKAGESSAPILEEKHFNWHHVVVGEVLCMLRLSGNYCQMRLPFVAQNTLHLTFNIVKPMRKVMPVSVST